MADAEERSIGGGASSPLSVADCPATSSMLPVMVSVASLVGCVYVIVTYCYVRALRQHPAGIMFGMSVYGAVYQFLFLLDRSTVQVDCTRMGLFVDFFLTGQETYMLLFAIDLLMALKNPFSASKGRMKTYHVVGGAWSLVCATISHFDKHDALFGFCWMSSSDDHLGLLRTVMARSSVEVIVSDPASESESDSAPTDAASNGTLTSGIFFALYIVVVYCTSLAAILRSWNTLAKGLPDTFMTRRRIHRHLKYYVGCYFGYWTLVLGCYVLFSIMPREQNDSTGGVRCRIWHLLKCLLLAKGMVCSLIWTRTSNILTIIEQLREFGYVDLPPHEDSINWALRLEILTKTTAGICAAADEAERHALEHARVASRMGLGLGLNGTGLSNGGPLDEIGGTHTGIHTGSLLNPPSTLFDTVLGNITSSGVDTDSSISPLYDRKEWYTHVEKIILEYRNDHRLRGPTSQGIVFKDFAPEVFRRLREEAHISTASYRTSLQQTTKERVSEGKSGAFFYFTEDRKYVVKTLSEEERKFLLSILPSYFRFVKRNPNTFMTRFFGCHGVTMYGKTVYFVVMQSVFDSTLQIHERFDLKGSWVGRLEGRKPSGTVATCKFCKAEYVVGGSHGQLCHVRRGGEGNWRHQYDQVGKDLNWNRHMALPYLTARAVATQLIADSSFLCRINCIDYSLLVGIHHRSFNVSHYSSADAFDLPAPLRASWGSSGAAGNDARARASSGDHRSSSSSCSSALRTSSGTGNPGVNTGMYPDTKPFHQAIQGGMSVDEVHGPGIYFMGIIDMLQPWNLRKRLEHFLRVYVLFQDKNGISVVNPRQYAERFQQRVVHELIYDGRFEHMATPRDDTDPALQFQHDVTAQLRPTTRLHSLNPFGNESGATRSTVLESLDARFDSTVLLERVSSSYLSPPQATPLGLPLRVSARMAAANTGGSAGVPLHVFGPTGTSNTRPRAATQPRASRASTFTTTTTGLPEHYSLGPRLSGGLVMEPPCGFFAATQRMSGGGGYQPVGTTTMNLVPNVADASVTNPLMRRLLAPVHASPPRVSSTSTTSSTSLGRTDSAGSLASSSDCSTLSPTSSVSSSVVPLYGASFGTGTGSAAVTPLATAAVTPRPVPATASSSLHSISTTSSSGSGPGSTGAASAGAVASPMSIETSRSDARYSYQIVHTPTFPDKSVSTMSA